MSVVAIGTDSKNSLITALSDEPRSQQSALLLLADESRSVFKQYGCFADHPLHGLFVIDSAGRRRWQAIGEQPYFDMDSLVEQCQRVQNK